MFVFKIGCIIAAREHRDAIEGVLRDFPGQLVLDATQIETQGTFLEKLERTQPDVLIVEFDLISGTLDETIRQMKSVGSLPKVILMHRQADPNLILRCLRAGADEYLYPPLETDLKSALERISAERVKVRAGTRPRGKVLGFLSAKGGCGATSAACHIGVELYNLTNLDVLVADLDLENGTVGFLMKSISRYSIVDALDNIKRLDTSFWKALVSNGIPGVEVLSAPQANATGTKIYRDPEDYRNIMRFARANYDWTVVDLGRGLSYPTASVLEEIDLLFLLATMEVPSLHQAKTICTALLDRSFPAHRLHVLLNRMPKRSELTLEELELMIGQQIYATLPNDYAGINNAYTEGTLVPANTLIGWNYRRVAGKIAGVETRQKKKFSLF